MSCILHIARDYPDLIDMNKTYGVRNLVRNVRGFLHYVFSLNRTSQPGREKIVKSEGNVYSILYQSMPYGLFMQYYLERVAKKLLDLVDKEDIRPDLIHCHKLTHEGIVGVYLSQHLGIPLVCSVRGDTDLTVMSLKPNYHAMYARIIDHAKVIFFIAPWTLNKMMHEYGSEISSKAILLPNIVGLDFDKPLSKPVIRDEFVTICHLNDYKRKNISRTIYAMDRCMTSGLDIFLDVIGGGPKASREKLRRDIRKCRSPRRFRIMGDMERSVSIRSLSKYAGLILPSHPETFGMVYLESLHAGIPFLHSRHSGVDGYFSDNEVAVSVNPKSVKSIAAGIRELYTKQREYKSNIRAQMESGRFKQFSTSNIVEVYEESISSVLGG